MWFINNCEIPVKIDYTKLTEKAIEEFLNFAQVPRPDYHLDAARAYLKDYAQSHGWEWHRDEYGNCWFDVPATSDCLCAPEENSHLAINETLHIHTLTPVLQSLGYALQHAGELR